MDTTVLGPTTECLAVVVEYNTKQTPEENQASIGHDRWDKSARISNSQIEKLVDNLPSLHAPRRNEFTKSITPNIFVDCDTDK